MFHGDPPPPGELAPYKLQDPLEEDGSATARKRRLPNKITIAKRGPLALQTPRGIDGNSSTLSFRGASVWGQAAPPSSRGKIYTNPHYYQKRSLTRFPVPNVQRPIDEIEGDLGEMSCAELTENIQLMGSWRSYPNKAVPPDPMMQYSHLPSVYPDTEHYTHSEQGAMGISITYSRHLDREPQINTYHYPHSRMMDASWSNPTALAANKPHQRGHTYPLYVNSFGTTWTPTSTYSPLHANRVTSRTPYLPVVGVPDTPKHGTACISAQRPFSTQTAICVRHSAVRPSIAPPGIRAVAMHRMKPLTAGTIIRGNRIHTS